MLPVFRPTSTNEPALPALAGQEDRPMTLKPMTPKTSRDLPSQKPRVDKERDSQEATIADAEETGDRDRDLVHGEGGTIDLPTRPGDLSKDD